MVSPSSQHYPQAAVTTYQIEESLKICLVWSVFPTEMDLNTMTAHQIQPLFRGCSRTESPGRDLLAQKTHREKGVSDEGRGKQTAQTQNAAIQ